MPNNQGQQQNQGQNQGSNRQKQPNPPVKLMLDGKASACNVSVTARPNQRIEFWAGNTGNHLIWKVVDDQSRSLAVTTDGGGIASAPKLDLTRYHQLKDYSYLTAVVSDGKQSAPHALPSDLQPTATAPAKRLKILSSENELVQAYENRFPMEIQTFERSNVIGTQRVLFTADGPVRIKDLNGNIIVENVRRWEFNTDAQGAHQHDVILMGYTKREVKYRVVGDTDAVKRILEMK